MIDVQNLFFSYTDAPPWVLKSLDLLVQKGEYISVVGDNGSGKSTLMRLLLGFLRPTRGHVHVGTKNIGYVPQRRDAMIDHGFPITLKESLTAYRRLKSLSAESVSDVLNLIRMDQMSDHLMGNLSGGQQQKVLIGRALLGRPDLLILDEPSTGIDQASQKEIYALLLDISRKIGTTIVSVEHNLEAAVTNSTKIYHLHGGSGHMCSPEQYRDEYLTKG
jgi:zinc transport system ATP-binding protein